MDIKNKILEKIKEYDVITIFGHIFPDGDCYGSQLGLKYAILDTFSDKKVYALGSGFKKMMPLIGGMDEVEDKVISSSLAIVLDCAQIERVEDKRVTLAKEVFFIDHHVKQFETSDVHYVNEKAVSNTEILTSLIEEWKMNLTQRAATALMLGLVTDGGRFLYTPSANEFLVASKLIEKGALLEPIYSVLYEANVKDLGLKGYVYSNCIKGKGVLYTIFNKNTVKEFNNTPNISSQTVNLLSSFQDYPIWASFAEYEDGRVKAEFRCIKGYNVSNFAISHGGGGHTCASGCTLSSMDEVENIIKELEELVEKNKYETELKAMIEASLLAREKILEVYNTDFGVEIKDDKSPVTKADQEADKIIYKYLKNKFPTYSFLTEESIDDLTRLMNRYVFIVDPVDGTKDFVDRNGEFTTNIALCENHEIVVGVVSIPVTGEIYYAVKGKGSYYLKDKNTPPIRIHVSDKIDDLTLYISRFHATDKEKAQVEFFPQIKKVEAHGSSLKACYIASGKGELHYRFSPGTKEWDTASIQLIVEEAGGLFVKPDGTRYTYNREDVYNREGYIIVNRKENILIKS